MFLHSKNTSLSQWSKGTSEELGVWINPAFDMNGIWTTALFQIDNPLHWLVTQVSPIITGDEDMIRCVYFKHLLESHYIFLLPHNRADLCQEKKTGPDLAGTRFVAGAAVRSRLGSATLEVEAHGANPDAMSTKGEQRSLGWIPRGQGLPMSEQAGPGRRIQQNHVP